MTKTLNFATISGSLRKGSYSTSVAETLQELVPDGVTVTRYDIADIPLYNEDIKDGDTAPEPVRDLAGKLAAADAIIVVSPEYNRGTPGVLKNHRGWHSKYLGENHLAQVVDKTLYLPLFHGKRCRARRSIKSARYRKK